MKIEYANRFTDWNTRADALRGDGQNTQVVKYDRTGTGEQGLIAAESAATQTRAWQVHQGLPVDATAVQRPIADWEPVHKT